MTWVEDAPRATKLGLKGATAMTSAGPVPVIAFAFETMDGQLTTISFISTKDGLKKVKSMFLRCYDEALREVAIIERSIKDVEDEEGP
jgi:hypothetical protein